MASQMSTSNRGRLFVVDPVRRLDVGASPLSSPAAGGHAHTLTSSKRSTSSVIRVFTFCVVLFEKSSLLSYRLRRPPGNVCQRSRRRQQDSGKESQLTDDRGTTRRSRTCCATCSRPPASPPPRYLPRSPGHPLRVWSGAAVASSKRCAMTKRRPRLTAAIPVGAQAFAFLPFRIHHKNTVAANNPSRTVSTTDGARAAAVDAQNRSRHDAAAPQPCWSAETFSPYMVVIINPVPPRARCQQARGVRSRGAQARPATTTSNKNGAPVEA